MQQKHHKRFKTERGGGERELAALSKAASAAQPLPHFALCELISHLRFTALSSGQGNFLSRQDRVVNFLLALDHFSL
jgi:hypothetical protein